MISIKKLLKGFSNPSDEVLVNYHLKRKLLNIEEEYCLIPEFDIYKLTPWDLITKYNGKFQSTFLLSVLAQAKLITFQGGFIILWALNFFLCFAFFGSRFI